MIIMEQQQINQQGDQQTPNTGVSDQQQNLTEQVVAVRKNGDGDIVELKLTSGQVVDYKTAQQMVKNNQIAGMNVFRGRDHEEHLRSDPDGRKDNNLDNLPFF
jgi:hypothetical protein